MLWECPENSRCGSVTRILVVVVSREFSLWECPENSHCGSVPRILLVGVSREFLLWECPENSHCGSVPRIHVVGVSRELMLWECPENSYCGVSREFSLWECPENSLCGSVPRILFVGVSRERCSVTDILKPVHGGKVHPKTCYEGTERDWRYSSTLSLTSALDGGWVVNATPRFLCLLKRELVPMVWEAQWAEGPVWREGENLAPPPTPRRCTKSEPRSPR